MLSPRADSAGCADAAPEGETGGGSREGARASPNGAAGARRALQSQGSFTVRATKSSLLREAKAKGVSSPEGAAGGPHKGGGSGAAAEPEDGGEAPRARDADASGGADAGAGVEGDALAQRLQAAGNGSKGGGRGGGRRVRFLRPLEGRGSAAGASGRLGRGRGAGPCRGSGEGAGTRRGDAGAHAAAGGPPPRGRARHARSRVLRPVAAGENLLPPPPPPPFVLIGHAASFTPY